MAVDFYTPSFYVLNNFSAHIVEFRGVLYPTAEHAYQATKCTDKAGKEAIRLARSPLLAKHVANEVYASVKDPDWECKKVAVMEELLRAKLAQHEEVLDALKRSGTEGIAEDSPVDFFWGAGEDGSEQNRLGKLWMKVRAEL